MKEKQKNVGRKKRREMRPEISRLIVQSETF